MITTNIDVTDGLTNGAMGTVTNVVIDETTAKMSTIIVAFDSKHVEQEAMHTSVYQCKPKCCTNTSNTGNISYTEKSIFQATRSQFPLTLACLLQYTNIKG